MPLIYPQSCLFLELWGFVELQINICKITYFYKEFPESRKSLVLIFSYSGYSNFGEAYVSTYLPDSMLILKANANADYQGKN